MWPQGLGADVALQAVIVSCCIASVWCAVLFLLLGLIQSLQVRLLHVA